MKFGYARVSGLSQDLELQVKQLEDQGVPEKISMLKNLQELRKSALNG